jgi:hypothetical protein
MALILKSNPAEIGQDGIFTSSPVEIYQRCGPQPGEQIFVWTAERAGGCGLAMCGTFLELSPERPRAIVQAFITTRRPSQVLNISDLRPFHRKINPSSAGPLRTLCDKLLVHSHNKIARLKPEEEERLNRHFDAEAEVARPVFSEGDPIFRAHLSRERDNRAVRLKKSAATRPLTCEICCFRFTDHYNNASDMIECHHLLPLGTVGHRMTRQHDLILVCANCHRIIHTHIRSQPDDRGNLSAIGLRQAILRR